MHGIYELKERLCEELEEYGKKDELDVGSLDVVDKLAHTVKNLQKIIDKSEGQEYSYMTDGGYYSNRRRSGYSRRGRNNRRYSMANDDMVKELRELMNDAPDDRTRNELQSVISRIENM